MSRSADLNWFGRSKFQVILGILAVAAFVQMSVASGLVHPFFESKPSVPRLLNDVALGYFSSWIFNILVIVLPTQAKRHRLRSWLAGRYISLKDDLVRHYLTLIDQEPEMSLIVALRNPTEFADYFCARHSADESRWDAIHNALDDWGLTQIRFSCQLFVSDFDLTIGLIGDLEPGVMKTYGRVRQSLLYVGTLEPNYVDINRLLMMLFPLHCPWQVLHGKEHSDSILSTINKM